MATLVKHLDSSIIGSQVTSRLKLVHNRRRTIGNVAGVSNTALPDSSAWHGSFSVPFMTKENNKSKYVSIAGWSAFEGEMEEIEEMDLYFTASDSAQQYPEGHPVEDLEYGICNDYPTQKDFDRLRDTIASVYKFGERGDNFVTLQRLNPITLVLKKGDMFSIHHGPLRIPMLYKVTRDATSDTLGRATIGITPRLRRNVAINDPITFFRPRSVFKLLNPFESSRRQTPAPLSGSISYEIIEAPEIFNERNIII